MNILTKTAIATAISATLIGCGGRSGGPAPVTTITAVDYFAAKTVVEAGNPMATGDEIFHNTITQYAVADVNGDGFDDVIAAYPGYANPDTVNFPNGPHTPVPIKILLQDGNGGIVDSTASMINGAIPKAEFIRDITVADFNGDGQVDIFFGNSTEFSQDRTTWAGADILLLSDGAGKYNDATANIVWTTMHNVNGDAIHYVHGNTAGDVDNDGDLDLLLNTTSGAGTALMINDGTGNFTESTNMPIDILPGNITSKVGDLWSGFIDANNDSNLDIAIYSNNEFGGMNTHAVYLNDGTADFTVLPRIPLPAPIGNGRLEDDAIVDYDGDGNKDILVHNFETINGQQHHYIQVYKGDGTGNFTDQTFGVFPNQDYTASERINSQSVFYDIDVNGDGKKDIVQTLGSGSDSILNILVNVNGVFTEVVTNITTIESQIIPIGLRGRW